mmetsp:Transcript_22453/g.36174  ORF Transcript_22453/g.36174 Transcript_22453/m.36174 type:complete len:202 (+) Transcript_22453:1-606(+)
MQRFYNMNFENNDDPIERKGEALASTSNEADEGSSTHPIRPTIQICLMHLFVAIGRGSVASKDTTTSAQRFYEMSFDPVAPEIKAKATAATVMSEETVDEAEAQHDDGASQGSVNLDEAEQNERKEENERGSVASRDTTTSAQRFYEMNFKPVAPEAKEEAKEKAKAAASDAAEDHDDFELKEAKEDAEEDQDGIQERKGN